MLYMCKPLSGRLRLIEVGLARMDTELQGQFYLLKRQFQPRSLSELANAFSLLEAIQSFPVRSTPAPGKQGGNPTVSTHRCFQSIFPCVR
jgi:hypothetical protein